MKKKNNFSPQHFLFIKKHKREGNDMKVNWKERLGLQKRSTAVNLTEGPIAKSILMFALPILTYLLFSLLADR